MSIRITFPEGRKPFILATPEILAGLGRCLYFTVMHTDRGEDGELFHVVEHDREADAPDAMASSNIAWANLTDEERELWIARAQELYSTMAVLHGRKRHTIEDHTR